MRQAVWDAVDKTRDGGDTKSHSKLRVVYCPRATSPTRSLKEENELLSKLQETVTGLGGEVIVFEKAKGGNNSTFASNQSPLEFVMDTVELFRSANIILGVHGE
jgi:capsular polysaccharide biosynthesis protein